MKNNPNEPMGLADLPWWKFRSRPGADRQHPTGCPGAADNHGPRSCSTSRAPRGLAPAQELDEALRRVAVRPPPCARAGNRAGSPRQGELAKSTAPIREAESSGLQGGTVVNSQNVPGAGGQQMGGMPETSAASHWRAETGPTSTCRYGRGTLGRGRRGERHEGGGGGGG